MHSQPVVMRKIIILSIAILLSIGLSFVVYLLLQPSVNRVQLRNLSDANVENVVLTVGINSLHVGTLWQGYDFEYAFTSPGEGVIRFEGVRDGTSLSCKAGYITPATSSNTEIVILANGTVQMYYA
ncbi:MAG: hypothetical protein AB3N28_12035, partial [Kordiimonas sp.]